MPDFPKSNTKINDHHIRNAGPILHKLIKPHPLSRLYTYLTDTS